MAKVITTFLRISSVYSWAVFLLLAVLDQVVVDVVLRLKYPNYALFGESIETSVTIAMWMLFLPVFTEADSIISRSITWNNPGKRFWIQLLVTWGIAIVFFILARVLRYTDLDAESFITFQDEGIRLLVFLVLLMLVMLVSLAFNVITNWNMSVSRLAAVEKENADFRFTMLKTQINPHFLFNNLNTLSGLIQEDQERAGSFLRELSTVYRNILDNREKNLLSLEEELIFFEPYKSMMETRFEDRLNIEIEGLEDSVKEAKVPALCLQILTENAIKHNVVSKMKPLTLKIYASGSVLWIVNPLQLKKTKEHSTKIGLNNIRKRLESVSSKSLIVEENNNQFKVGIPLIQAS